MYGNSSHVAHSKRNNKRKHTTDSHIEIKEENKNESAASTGAQAPTETDIKQNKSEIPLQVKKVKPSSLWNFVVDYNDHFETPKVAYSDIAPMLNAVATALNKSASDLTIYDPYWCEGSMVEHLKDLGFPNVINRNRDFYADVKKKAVPEHDILVTNPPYSGEHKVKLLSFLAAHCSSSSGSSAASAVPFALLLPVYVATKSYWKDFAAQQARAGRGVLYLLPPDHYEYAHPEGTGKAIPPFYSAWFIGGLDTQLRDRVMRAFRETPRKATAGNTAGVKKLSFGTTQVAESLSVLAQRGLVVDAKRPNPKQRQKMRAKHTS